MNTLPSRLRPSYITAYVVRKDEDCPRYLMMRRTKEINFGIWQSVTGGIEEGETASEAALREVLEETGLVPSLFCSADYVEVSYAHRIDRVLFSPVFIAFVQAPTEVILCPGEHDIYQWATYEQARLLIEFPSARSTLEHVHNLIQEPIPDRFVLVPQL